MSKFLRIMFLAGMLGLFAGCASEESLIAPPSESTLGSNNYKDSPALNKNRSDRDTLSEIVISDTLSFSDALSKALLNNPDLQSFGWEVRAREAKRLQAALPPNPTLEAEMENFGGTGPMEGFDSREVTIRLSQKVLLGADRLKAKRLAAANRKLAGWDYETQRLEVLTGVTKAYISALEAQKQWQKQQDLVQVAEELYNSVSAQLEAGKVSQLEKTKAQVELSRTRIELKNVRNQFEAARSKLAAYWGSKRPMFKVLDGELTTHGAAPPAYSAIAEYIERNPDVARWTSEVKQREAALALEQARGVPDLTLSAGYKRAEDVGAEAAVVGVSIPIAIFDRNQGNIKAARYELNRVESKKESAVTETFSALQKTYSELKAAYHEVQQLEQKVLPGSRSAFEAAKTGYRQGKFDYLEVLDAQRTLFSSRTSYLRALARYNLKITEIERLIGTSISDITTNQ